MPQPDFRVHHSGQCLIQIAEQNRAVGSGAAVCADHAWSQFVWQSRARLCGVPRQAGLALDLARKHLPWGEASHPGTAASTTPTSDKDRRCFWLPQTQHFLVSGAAGSAPHHLEGCAACAVPWGCWLWLWLALCVLLSRRKGSPGGWQRETTLYSSCLHWWQTKRHSYKLQRSLKISWELKRLVTAFLISFVWLFRPVEEGGLFLWRVAEDSHQGCHSHFLELIWNLPVHSGN